MLKYVCKICGQSFEHHIPFNAHLTEKHHLNSKNYYDQHLKKPGEGQCVICNKPTAFISATKGYRECCSVGCANTQRTRKVEETGQGSDVTCAICNEKLHSEGTMAHVYTRLFYHINTVHGITSQKDYYDDFLKKEDEGICPICGKETEFRSIALGYNTYCSAGCSVENAKRSSDSAINTYKNIKKEQSLLAKMVSSIKEKYQKFISGGDKATNYSDVRENPTIRKNVNDEKVYDDPENKGKKITVKTEISCNPTYDWIGTQKYTPKTEGCTYKQRNWYNDDINDDQGFSSNEWCG